MLKAILVDDEYLVIESIRNAVKWDELGFEIAGQALDGEEGLALVERVQPQLAIVDINMPFIDGLEFARIAHEKYPDLKIIILTGYGTFEYAREAMRSGVSSYLLKPVDKTELEKALAVQKQAIEEAQRAKLLLSRLETASRENDESNREQFVLAHILEAPGGVEGGAAERFFGLYPSFTCTKAAVAAVAIDNAQTLGGDELQNARLKVREAFDTALIAMPHVSLIDRAGTVVLIAGAGQPQCGGIDREFLHRVVDGVRCVAKGCTVTVTAGVGCMQDFPNGAAASYREAQQALRSRVLLGRNCAIAFDDPRMQGKLCVNTESLRQNLLINLRLGNREEAGRLIEAAFASVAGGKSSLEALRQLLSELMLAAGSFAGECGLDDWQAGSRNPGIDELIDRSGGLEDVKGTMIELFCNLIARTAGAKKTGAQAAVEKAKAFIDANLHDSEMDLDGIAGSIFINASYLSSIFKQETGVSITDYIKTARLSAAKGMMGQGYSNVIAIAEKVGFFDANYFRKCFKAAYGVTPSDYIDKLGK